MKENKESQVLTEVQQVLNLTKNTCVFDAAPVEIKLACTILAADVSAKLMDIMKLREEIVIANSAFIQEGLARFILACLTATKTEEISKAIDQSKLN